MLDETQTQTQTQTDATPTTSTAVKSEPTFTQADVDRILKERLGRAKADKESARSELLAELAKEAGVAVDDPAKAADMLKSRLAAAKKAEEEKLSEQEKLQKQLDALMKERDDAKANAAKIEAERRLEKRDDAIVKALKIARANEADDLFILMSAKKPELVAAVMDEDGKVDEKALKAFVDATKEAYKSRFVGMGPGSPSNSGGRNPDPSADANEAARKAMFKRARRDI